MCSFGDRLVLGFSVSFQQSWCNIYGDWHELYWAKWVRRRLTEKEQCRCKLKKCGHTQIHNGSMASVDSFGNDYVMPMSYCWFAIVGDFEQMIRLKNEWRKKKKSSYLLVIFTNHDHLYIPIVYFAVDKMTHGIFFLHFFLFFVASKGKKQNGKRQKANRKGFICTRVVSGQLEFVSLFSFVCFCWLGDWLLQPLIVISCKFFKFKYFFSFRKEIPIIDDDVFAMLDL